MGGSAAPYKILVANPEGNTQLEKSKWGIILKWML
jgi:hypothetical protein